MHGYLHRLAFVSLGSINEHNAFQGILNSNRQFFLDILELLAKDDLSSVARMVVVGFRRFRCYLWCLAGREKLSLFSGE